MSFSIGIVGLPNVGKSTLFKALTKKQVDAANYPFCTIDPNVGTVAVPDERIDALAKVSESAKVLPTTIEFVDIAGLVKGASKGEGLGNKFLANIREVDAIVQVVRNFSDSNVIHVHNKVDPDSDKQTINLELILADLDTATKRRDKLTKMARGQDKEAIKALAVIEKIYAALENEQLASSVMLDDDEQLAISDLHLLTRKPMLYVHNVDEDQVQPDSDFITISAKIEAELSELSPEDAKAFLADLGVTESGLDKLIKAAYKLLNLITYFTSGPTETRAWTIQQGTLAPQAAGVIHTDFEKGFIRAEVINWQKLVEAGGEAAAKEKGIMRTEGKNYEVQDGDVMHFLHNA